MKKPALPAVLLLVPLLVSCGSGVPADGGASTAPPPADAGEVHWSYDGEEGQDEWGDLSADFETCSAGHAQSPIDLPAHADQESTEYLKITSTPTVAQSVDTGHTIQLVPERGASRVERDGTEFDLAQLHFHAPSEHTVDGEAMDAELHFVYATPGGQTLVVGVFAEEGTRENKVWQPFVEGAASPGTTDLPFYVAAMLPTDPTYVSYLGSLTTPPCTEGVHWVVYATPVKLSADQIAVLEEASQGHNARHTQPEGNRTVSDGTAVLAH